MKEIGLSIFRAAIGLLMIPHGYGKLKTFIAGGDIHFYNFLGLGEKFSLILAILAEFVCSILLVLGIKTRYVSIPLIITMAVAGLIVHADDPWNRKEMAFLYLVGFLCMALTGGGKYVINRRWR